MSFKFLIGGVPVECDTAEELLTAMAQSVHSGVAFEIPGKGITAKAPATPAPAPAPEPPPTSTGRKRVRGTKARRGERTLAQIKSETRDKEAVSLDTRIVLALKDGPLTSEELAEALGLDSSRKIVHVMRRLLPWYRRRKSTPRYLGTGKPKTWTLRDCAPVKITGVDPDPVTKADTAKPPAPKGNVRRLVVRDRGRPAESESTRPGMPASIMRPGASLEAERRQQKLDRIKPGDWPLTLSEVSPGAVSFMCPESLAIAGFVSTQSRWNPDSKIRPYLCLSRGETHSCWVPLSSRSAPDEYRIGPEAKEGGSIGWRTRPSWMWEPTPVLLLSHEQALAAGKKENAYPTARCRVEFVAIERLRHVAYSNNRYWARYARERMETLGVAWWVEERAEGVA